jgi:hypothetical protein
LVTRRASDPDELIAQILEEAYELPEKGPIGLEGDRGQMEYRRIRLREE